MREGGEDEGKGKGEGEHVCTCAVYVDGCMNLEARGLVDCMTQDSSTVYLVWRDSISPWTRDTLPMTKAFSS